MNRNMEPRSPQLKLARLALVCAIATTAQSLHGQDGLRIQSLEIQSALESAKASGKPANAAAASGAKPQREGEKPAGESPQKTDKDQPEASPKTTPRPQKPETAPNPEELQARPDGDGLVRFNFQGQPWLGVLEWLAEISELSLDWQEVPNDFLNLRTQRSYKVDEARDLINRHLLDRGFTLLKHGEVLSVANIKKLDPSLVPRVRPGDLDQRQPHEFVKVSFPLEWMIAEVAVEELKPMLSPNGKLTALKSTNRIEATDAVVNLREIRELLADEQSGQGRKRLVSEFKLQHVRAIDVFDALHDLLGLEKKPPASQPESPEMQQMRQQQAMMRMQQQQQGGQPAPAKPKPDVHLVINQRENSVIAHAPADQMAVIAEAVELIDVPVDQSKSLLRHGGRMQIHRMSSLDPEVLVRMLNELGELDPSTKLQADKKNRAIMAHASLADHMTIRMLINKLDGTDRKFEVIRLRRLEADYVAGTIEFMMGGGEKKKDNNRFNPYYFDFMPYGRQNQQEDESRKFRVDADVENNRLLLWANEIELAEIQNLLMKLGELPGAGGNPATLRVLDTIDPDEAEELLRRLQKTWPGISPHPLQISPEARTPGEASPTSQPMEGKQPVPKSKPRPAPKAERTPQASRRSQTDRQWVRLVDLQEKNPPNAGNAATSTDDFPNDPAPADQGTEFKKAPQPDDDDTTEIENDRDSQPERPAAADPRMRDPRRSTPSASPAPVRIGRGPDGRLVITSPDPAALDQLEDLVAQIAPPKKDYKVFKLKHKSTWAWGVAQNLKDFFAEKDKDKNSGGYDPFWGGFRRGGQAAEDSARRLSKRRPLKFIDDKDSNSILVTGADPQQLKVIQELIDLYDVEESKDSQSARLTRIFSVKYSKAKVIADALKEVYRDLLSVNDPAMQQQQQNQKNQRPAEPTYTYIYGGGGSGDDKKPDMPLKFKGALSIGVDEFSNTLIVSAADGLLENVAASILSLDEAARPMVPRMQVVKVGRNLDVAELQKRLSKLTGKPPTQQPQPGQRQPFQPPQEQPPQPGNGSTLIIEN